MFCKWCGQTLASGELKCRRCGKEIPPMSDCGGFFDLIALSKPNSVETNTRPVSFPPISAQRQQPIPPKKRRKLPIIALVVISVLLIASVALNIFLLTVNNGEEISTDSSTENVSDASGNEESKLKSEAETEDESKTENSSAKSEVETEKNLNLKLQPKNRLS